MSSRSSLLLRIRHHAGAGVEVLDARDGWPGVASIGTDRQFSVHVGPVGPSHRNRDSVERRFQNPGQNKPIVSLPGTIPLLLGFWSEGARPVLVAADALRRVGLITRFSVFIPLETLSRAAEFGWAEHESSSGEHFVAFHPSLLSAYAGSLESNTRIDPDLAANVISASGLMDSDSEEPRERARRATMALVRSAAFARQVADAYDGLCAMCSLDLGLCQGAHIYPACAPNSLDRPTNGVALCGNHHLAFDKHIVWVHPKSRSLKFEPRVLEKAQSHSATRRFVEGTAAALSDPSSCELRPTDEMFLKRYDYFKGLYDWAI